MASLCRNWCGDFAVQNSLASFTRLQFVAGLFKNRCRGFVEAMAAAGARAQQDIASAGRASNLISLGFNEEAGWPAMTRPSNPVAGDRLESGRWPFTMSISS
jgi:hypothetical protein